jgi:hypothetical protein
MKCKNCDGTMSNGKFWMMNGEVVHDTCKDEYERKSKGLLYNCPKCNTTGKIPDPKGRKEKKKVYVGNNCPCAYDGCRGCSMCGYAMNEVTIKIECTLCDGVGWLKSKPKPIEKVVDWVK